MRNESVGKDPAPLMGDQYRDDHVRQKRRAQHFEHKGDSSKGSNNQQQRYGSACQERPEPSGTSIEQGHARADCNHVSGDIEGIRNDEHDEKNANDRSTRPLETLDSQFAQTLASREGRSIAYLLDRRHERKGDEGRPNEGQTEL